MSSLIFKEFEEFGQIPKTEDVAYQVTKQIYGLDFANFFCKCDNFIIIHILQSFFRFYCNT